MNNISIIAESILKSSGRYQPEIKSNTRGSFTVRRDDFKNESTFDYIVGTLQLDDEFHKEIKKHDTGDEPVTEVGDYDELEIHVSNSIMR